MSESTAVFYTPAAISPPRVEDTSIVKAKKVPNRAVTEPLLVQVVLIGIALLFLAFFLVLPLAVVYHEAFAGGWEVIKATLNDPDSRAAIWLTLKVAAIVVPLNTVFGIAAGWALAKFRFFGRSFLITLIDIPFSISPVIAGMIFILMFGREGIFGKFLQAHDWRIAFAVPGIVLATAFVTFPFVARELIAFMEAQGTEEEEAAVVLGASGWQTFWRVTLPNIRWGLLYGIILCNARAMGEFGAVSVISAKVVGQNTIPLQVELLYNGYPQTPAFALASVLTILGLITLVIKKAIETRTRRQLQAGESGGHG